MFCLLICWEEFIIFSLSNHQGASSHVWASLLRSLHVSHLYRDNWHFQIFWGADTELHATEEKKTQMWRTHGEQITHDVSFYYCGRNTFSPGVLCVCTGWSHWSLDYFQSHNSSMMNGDKLLACSLRIWKDQMKVVATVPNGMPISERRWIERCFYPAARFFSRAESWFWLTGSCSKNQTCDLQHNVFKPWLTSCCDLGTFQPICGKMWKNVPILVFGSHQSTWDHKHIGLFSTSTNDHNVYDIKVKSRDQIWIRLL